MRRQWRNEILLEDEDIGVGKNLQGYGDGGMFVIVVAVVVVTVVIAIIVPETVFFGDEGPADRLADVGSRGAVYRCGGRWWGRRWREDERERGCWVGGERDVEGEGCEGVCSGAVRDWRRGWCSGRESRAEEGVEESVLAENLE